MGAGIRARGAAHGRTIDGLDEFGGYAQPDPAQVRYPRRSRGLRRTTSDSLSGVRAACAQGAAQILFGQFPLRPESSLDTLTETRSVSADIAAGFSPRPPRPLRGPPPPPCAR